MPGASSSGINTSSPPSSFTDMRPSNAASRSSAISSPSGVGQPRRQLGARTDRRAQTSAISAARRRVIQVVIDAFLRTNRRNATPSAAASTRRSARRRRRRARVSNASPHRARRRHLLLPSEALRPTTLGLGADAFLISPARACRLNPAATPFRLITDASRRDRRRLLRLPASASARRAASMCAAASRSRLRNAQPCRRGAGSCATRSGAEGSLRRGPLLGQVLVRVRAQRTLWSPPRSPRAPTFSSSGRSASATPRRSPRRPSPTSPRDSAASASSRISR